MWFRNELSLLAEVSLYLLSVASAYPVKSIWYSLHVNIPANWHELVRSLYRQVKNGSNCDNVECWKWKYRIWDRLAGCDPGGHMDEGMWYGCQMDCSRIPLVVWNMKMADKLPFRRWRTRRIDQVRCRLTNKSQKVWTDVQNEHVEKDVHVRRLGQWVIHGGRHHTIL